MAQKLHRDKQSANETSELPMKHKFKADLNSVIAGSPFASTPTRASTSTAIIEDRVDSILGLTSPSKGTGQFEIIHFKISLPAVSRKFHRSELPDFEVGLILPRSYSFCPEFR